MREPVAIAQQRDARRATLVGGEGIEPPTNCV